MKSSFSDAHRSTVDEMSEVPHAMISPFEATPSTVAVKHDSPLGRVWLSSPAPRISTARWMAMRSSVEDGCGSR